MDDFQTAASHSDPVTHNCWADVPLNSQSFYQVCPSHLVLAHKLLNKQYEVFTVTEEASLSRQGVI